MSSVNLCSPSKDIKITIDLDEKTYTVNPDGTKKLGVKKSKFFGDQIDQIRDSALKNEHKGVYGIYHCKNCFNKVVDALGKENKRIG